MKSTHSASGLQGRLRASFTKWPLACLTAAFLLAGPACLSQTPQAAAPLSGQGQVISQAMKRDAARLAARRAAQGSGLQRELQPKGGGPGVTDHNRLTDELPQASTPNGAETANTPRQGIKLSGWWTIEVKNPDGTVATHREFENSLSSGGEQFLAFLLAGRVSVGEPMINLANRSSSTGSPCISTNACELYVNSNGQWAAFCGQSGDPGSCFPGLTPSLTNVSIDNNNGTVTALQFSGQILADQNGTISQVSTYFIECTDSGVTPSIGGPVTSANPSTCSANPGAYNGTLSYNILTQANFSGDSGAISVNAGQTVSVSVALGFFSYNF